MNGCTSYERDIRPKFTAEDISHMNNAGLNLADYATVKDNANGILKRLMDSDNPMPPKPRGPWPQEWIDCFKQWTDSGKLP